MGLRVAVCPSRLTFLVLSAADSNRPKTEEERRERCLESKRRWARKNRAMRKAGKDGSSADVMHHQHQVGTVHSRHWGVRYSCLPPPFPRRLGKFQAMAMEASGSGSGSGDSPGYSAHMFSNLGMENGPANGTSSTAAGMVNFDAQQRWKDQPHHNQRPIAGASAEFLQSSRPRTTIPAAAASVLLSLKNTSPPSSSDGRDEEDRRNGGGGAEGGRPRKRGRISEASMIFTDSGDKSLDVGSSPPTSPEKSGNGAIGSADGDWRRKRSDSALFHQRQPVPSASTMDFKKPPPPPLLPGPPPSNHQHMATPTPASRLSFQSYSNVQSDTKGQKREREEDDDQEVQLLSPARFSDGRRPSPFDEDSHADHHTSNTRPTRNDQKRSFARLGSDGDDDDDDDDDDDVGNGPSSVPPATAGSSSSSSFYSSSLCTPAPPSHALGRTIFSSAYHSNIGGSRGEGGGGPLSSPNVNLSSPAHPGMSKALGLAPNPPPSIGVWTPAHSSIGGGPFGGGGWGMTPDKSASARKKLPSLREAIGK